MIQSITCILDDHPALHPGIAVVDYSHPIQDCRSHPWPGGARGSDTLREGLGDRHTDQKPP